MDRPTKDQYIYSVSTHSSTGTPISKFQLDSSPTSLTVTTNGRLAVIHGSNPAFHLLDASTGTALKSSQDPDTMDWTPSALCYSKKDKLIFVGSSNGVYMYNSDAEYLKCITTNVNAAQGLALSVDCQKLVVPNKDQSTFKIFRRP